MFSKVNKEGNWYVLLNAIVDHHTDVSKVIPDNTSIKSNNCGCCKHDTTKKWEVLPQQKDGSPTWETLISIKQCYPLQLAHYAVRKGIDKTPAFAWWVPHMIRKNRYILKVKYTYQSRTHKFGRCIPKNVEETLQFDKDNGNHIWWESICKEIKSVRVAFELFDSEVYEKPHG